MKTKLSVLSGLMALLCAMPAWSTTLAVSASATRVGSLYDYTYTFTVSGGSIDNIYLGSDDLSPTSLLIKLDGTTTSNWSWLGNDTPQNYLQFFSTNGSTLGSTDTLGVTFASAFGPASSHFAVGLNSGTGATTNELTGVLAPTAAPEPASLGLLLSAGISAVTGMGIWKRRRAA